jgi:uncharacterized protein
VTEGPRGPALSRDPRPAGPLVTGFSGPAFKVGEAIYAAGLWLTPEVASGWDAPSLDALDVAALAPLLTLDPQPEFLLLGTGSAMRRPPVGFVVALDQRGIGVEAMDSRAAARAWGVLRGEGRWIVAALLPLGD